MSFITMDSRDIDHVVPQTLEGSVKPEHSKVSECVTMSAAACRDRRRRNSPCNRDLAASRS